MEKKYYFILRLKAKANLIFGILVLFLGSPSVSRAVNYSGNYNVGTAGTWTNLTNAFTAISAGTVTGNINLILVAGYPAAAETYPIAPSTNNSTYSVTIYPGVAGLSITSANATTTLNFTGCDNYILDGRVNLAGAMNLIVANSNVTGSAIQLINDASYNTIRYCNVQGVNTTTTEGVILFSTSASTGNDYNTIDRCDIHDGATTPYNCIYSLGTAGSENDHNTVSNCNMYNFHIATGNGAHGIYVAAGNTDWTISGNSCYQTSARVPTGAAFVRAIEIVSTGNNYVISGNYVGGSAANCGGGALSFDAGATQDNSFYGIFVSSGTSSACYVQNNTISNIIFGCKSATANTYSFLGIVATAGYVDISNNIVGAATGNGSISITYATTGTQGFVAGGISSDAVQGSVSNNTIGSITVGGGKTTLTGSIRAIECDGALSADFIINGNTIGSTTTANSIQYTPTAATPVTMMGIFPGTTGAFTTTISDNIIQNVTNTTTGSAGTFGIYDPSLNTTLTTITRNTIANLTTPAPALTAMVGIYQGNTTAGQTISNNIIHDLSNTNATLSVDNSGIYYVGPTTGANVISGNNIYNLTLSSTSTGASIYGINMSSGIATVSNNMITLGNGVGTGYTINGIDHGSGTAGNNYYFNSVYIGGTTVAGATSANAFYSSTTAARVVENNIFYNARSGGAILHYAINVSSFTGLTSNYNDLYSATDVGRKSAAPTASYVTIANWRTASGTDANSINADPTFVAPTAATPDLHINTGSPVISVGLNGIGITNDFDLTTRSSTPDIGADEYHTNYYSKSAGNLELVTTWGVNTDGSGANPPNFTTRDCIFNIRNNAAPTIGAAWTVSGSGDLVILGDGTTACNFTVPGASAFSGTINISNNGTLTNQNATNPTLNSLNAGSTVNYNSANGVAQTVYSPITYGNLILSNSTGSGTSVKSLAATINIQGNLTINAYATFDLVTYNSNRNGGGGTFTLASNGIMKISGTSGGAGSSSNFPDNFSVMSLASSSTVEYYGATQTIYEVPTYGNLTISIAGTKTAGGSLTVAGNFTINSPATFAGSTFTLNFMGNFINNGTFTANTSIADFDGSAAQVISGSSTTTFYQFTLNNAAGLTLSSPANVSNSLALTAGLLNTTSTNILTMQPGSTAPALTAASTSYVNGPLMYQKNTAASATLNFPIGKSPDCRPVALTVAHTNTTLYNYQAEAFNANPWTTFGSGVNDMPTTVDTISAVHYVTIARTDGASVSQPLANLSGNAQIQMFFGTNDMVYQGATLTIVKNTSATPATWIDIGGTSALGNFGTPQAGSVTSTSLISPFNSFSSFALASMATGWNSLPVELLDFTAVPNGEKVDIKWTTVSETNNAYFTLEKSVDGKTFVKVAEVQGAGNSIIARNYFDVDYQPYSGVSYYRLKQTDNNGTYKYFPMVPVNFDPGKNIVLYPNPAGNSDKLNLKLSGYQNEEVLVVLRDLQGREFYSKMILIEKESQVYALENTDPIPAGTYIVVASSTNKIYSYKLIIK